MILPINIKSAILVLRRVDFRKGFNGLLAESYSLNADPYDGECVVFIKRDKTQIRALVGDALGLYLLNRRFDSGRLMAISPVVAGGESCPLRLAELAMLLDGTNYQIKKRIKTWR